MYMAKTKIIAGAISFIFDHFFIAHCTCTEMVVFLPLVKNRILQSFSAA